VEIGILVDSGGETRLENELGAAESVPINEEVARLESLKELIPRFKDSVAVGTMLDSTNEEEISGVVVKLGKAVPVKDGISSETEELKTCVSEEGIETVSRTVYEGIVD
jgi:hypothetical protein